MWIRFGCTRPGKREHAQIMHAGMRDCAVPRVTLSVRLDEPGATPTARMWPNVLAFSCEAANAMIECSQDMARLRLLQRRVRPSATQKPQVHGHPGASRLPTRSSASRKRVALNPKNQSRSRCPTFARGGPAQARGEPTSPHFGSSLLNHVCASAHPALAQRARSTEPMMPHRTRREHP